MVEWKEWRGTSTALISVGGLVVLELWADGQDGDFDALCDIKLIAKGLPTLAEAKSAAIAHAVKVLTEALAQVAPELVVVPREPTEVMSEVGKNSAEVCVAYGRDPYTHLENAKDVYRAMIAAAPKRGE